MTPALTVAFLWLFFTATHVGLAARPLRDPLVARLGERGFAAFFSLVASLLFAALVRYYADHRFEGAPGPALGAVPGLHGVLVVVAGGGIALMLGGLAAYPRSPMGPARRTPDPYGLARVTRHSFFAGLVLFAASHALLASRLVGVVMFAGFALLAGAGSRHQDRKLLRLRGEPYRRYLAATSMLPFAAVLAGRQRVAWGELPRAALVAGVLAAILLRRVHAGIFAHGGAWVIGTTVGFVAVVLALDWWQSRATRVRPVSRAARVP
jgi:uncharacterized membrane protein